MCQDWCPIFQIILLMEEILRSPVEVGSLPHDLQGLQNIPGGDRRISEASTVGPIGLLLEYEISPLCLLTSHRYGNPCWDQMVFQNLDMETLDGSCGCFDEYLKATMSPSELLDRF